MMMIQSGRLESAAAKKRLAAGLSEEVACQWTTNCNLPLALAPPSGKKVAAAAVQAGGYLFRSFSNQNRRKRKR